MIALLLLGASEGFDSRPPCLPQERLERDGRRTSHRIPHRHRHLAFRHAEPEHLRDSPRLPAPPNAASAPVSGYH